MATAKRKKPPGQERGAGKMRRSACTCEEHSFGSLFTQQPGEMFIQQQFRQRLQARIATKRGKAHGGGGFPRAYPRGSRLCVPASVPEGNADGMAAIDEQSGDDDVQDDGVQDDDVRGSVPELQPPQFVQKVARGESRLLFLRTPNAWIIQNYSMVKMCAEPGYASVVQDASGLRCSCSSFSVKALCKMPGHSLSCVHTDLVQNHADRATEYSHASINDSMTAAVLPLLDYDSKSPLGLSNQKPKQLPYAIKLQSGGYSIVTVQTPRRGGQTMRCTTHLRALCQCTKTLVEHVDFGESQPTHRRPNTSRPSKVRLETLPFAAMQQSQDRTSLSQLFVSDPCTLPRCPDSTALTTLPRPPFLFSCLKLTGRFQRESEIPSTLLPPEQYTARANKDAPRTAAFELVSVTGVGGKLMRAVGKAVAPEASVGDSIYSVGDVVEACFEGGQQFYRCTVTAVRGGGTYDAKYESLDFGVLQHRITTVTEVSACHIFVCCAYG